MILNELNELIYRAQINDPTLLELNLEKYGLSLVQLQALTEALAKNTFIKKVDLSYNSIGLMGAELIAQLLEVNKSIEVINLENNNLKNAGAKALAKAIVKNKTLKVLKFSYNEIESAGMKAIFDAVAASKSLIYIESIVNRMGIDGARSLARALVGSRTLRGIDVRDDYSMGAEGCRLIHNALLLNEEITFFMLDRLEHPVEPIAKHNLFETCRKHVKEFFKGEDDTSKEFLLVKHLTSLFKENYYEAIEEKLNNLLHSKRKMIDLIEALYVELCGLSLKSYGNITNENNKTSKIIKNDYINDNEDSYSKRHIMKSQDKSQISAIR